MKTITLNDFKKAVNKLSYECLENEKISIPVKYLLDVKREIEKLESKISTLEVKYKITEQERKNCLSKLIKQDIKNFDYYI